MSSTAGGVSPTSPTGYGITECLRSGSFSKALLTKDVILDAVGVAAGGGALYAGARIFKAAQAAGIPTRTVPQLIGPAKNLPMGYFQFATGHGQMSQAEFLPRLGSFGSTIGSLGGVGAGAPDGIGDLKDWSNLTFLKPIEERAP